MRQTDDSPVNSNEVRLAVEPNRQRDVDNLCLSLLQKFGSVAELVEK